VPTLLRNHGLRYFFWSNEGNEPPHVHVSRDDNEAKFWLDPVRLDRNYGLSPADVRRATLTITEHEHEFIAAYRAG
jgi:hypothetical protein